MVDLAPFAQAASERIGDWTSLGIEAELVRSPDDGRLKASAWVRAHSGDRGGELRIWDSGEGDLEYLDAGGNEIIQRHFDNLTNEAAAALLDELVLHISSS